MGGPVAVRRTITISPEDDRWLQSVVERTGLKQSQVVSEMIRRARGLPRRFTLPAGSTPSQDGLDSESMQEVAS